MTRPQTLALAPGVIAEDMGDCFLVMVPGQSNALTLTGTVTHVIRAVVEGTAVPAAWYNHVDGLINAGVVTGVVSRRSLLGAGAIGVGAGIVALSMPSVAAASSSAELPVNTTRFRVDVHAGSNQQVDGITYLTAFTLRLEDRASGSSQPVTDLPMGFTGVVTLQGGRTLDVLRVEVLFGGTTWTMLRWTESAPKEVVLEEWEQNGVELRHQLEFTLDGVRYQRGFTTEG